MGSSRDMAKRSRGKKIEEVTEDYTLWTKNQLYDRIEELTLKSVKLKFSSEEWTKNEVEKMIVRKALLKFRFD